MLGKSEETEFSDWQRKLLTFLFSDKYGYHIQINIVIPGRRKILIVFEKQCTDLKFQLK